MNVHCDAREGNYFFALFLGGYDAKEASAVADASFHFVLQEF